MGLLDSDSNQTGTATGRATERSGESGPAQPDSMRTAARVLGILALGLFFISFFVDRETRELLLNGSGACLGIALILALLKLFEIAGELRTIRELLERNDRS